MTVTVTGATGLVGNHLTRALLEAGHTVRALARKKSGSLPAAVRFFPWEAGQSEPPAESLENVDAIVHLAGEPVAQRWTPEARQRIRASRVDGTRHLVNTLSTISRRPPALISASAIGIYGDRGNQILTEQSSPGGDFLAQLVVDWEQASLLAESLGMRVVPLRFGLILASDGGALKKMLPPFRFGVGGRLGSGRQWNSWIHIDDVVHLILFALARPDLRGPINAVAPNPVTNADFTKTLAATLHRPAIFPVPKLALRLLFGEMSSVLLASQRVLPESALAAGFTFRYAQLRAAFDRLL